MQNTLNGDSKSSAQVAPVVLTILDGWGHREGTESNAIRSADTPVMDALWQAYPHTLVAASGSDVGLPNAPTPAGVNGAAGSWGGGRDECCDNSPMYDGVGGDDSGNGCAGGKCKGNGTGCGNNVLVVLRYAKPQLFAKTGSGSTQDKKRYTQTKEVSAGCGTSRRIG